MLAIGDGRSLKPLFPIFVQDHKDFNGDIEDFPYRIYHGNIDVTILKRVKDCKLAPQVSLNEAKAHELEVSFYRDPSLALEVSKITGDLIALLLGINVSHAFHSDMTLLAFVKAGDMSNIKRTSKLTCNIVSGAFTTLLRFKNMGCVNDATFCVRHSCWWTARPVQAARLTQIRCCELCGPKWKTATFAASRHGVHGSFNDENDDQHEIFRNSVMDKSKLRLTGFPG